VEAGDAGWPVPLRVLLVSDDAAFAEHVRRAAARVNVEIAVAAPDDDLVLAAFSHGAGVLAVDADEAPLRRSRTAAAIAGGHPGATVVLLASRPELVPQCGLPLVAKLPGDELLWKLGRMRQASAG
jgi:hypothetical protein